MHAALSVGATPAEKAQWAEGFTAGGALLLIHDDALLGVLDRWVRSLDDTEFLEVAPLLRRSFGGFSPAERGNLLRATRSLSGGRATASAPDMDLTRADGVLATAQVAVAGGIVTDPDISGDSAISLPTATRPRDPTSRSGCGAGGC